MRILQRDRFDRYLEKYAGEVNVNSSSNVIIGCLAGEIYINRDGINPLICRMGYGLAIHIVFCDREGWLHGDEWGWVSREYFEYNPTPT